MQSQMNPNVAFQPPQSQHSNQPRFVVVNETPPAERLTFPITFREKPVLGISVAKIVIGFIQLVAGIANIFFLPFFTSIIAFPIWCGLLVRRIFLYVRVIIYKSNAGLSSESFPFTSGRNIKFLYAAFIVKWPAIAKIADEAKVEQRGSPKCGIEFLNVVFVGLLVD